jgi:para-nitrobenzyl esterase
VDRLLAAQAALSARRRFGQGGLPFAPIVDGAMLAEKPLAAVARGDAASVELLIGTNRDESTLFSVGDRGAFSLDDAGLRRRLARVLPGASARPTLVDDAVDVYAKARSDRGEATTPFALWTAMVTDLVFRIPSIRFTEAQAAHQANTFAYLFTWPTPVLGGILGSPHALEIPFVFGTYDQPGFDHFTGADRDPAAAVLAGRVMDAWTTFARTGRPDGDGSWPGYGSGSESGSGSGAPGRSTMVIDRTWRVEAAPMEAERRFWDSLAPG